MGQVSRYSNNNNNKLTERDKYVLQMLAQGYTYKQVGNQIGVSCNMVKLLTQEIYRKLDVNNNVAAVAKALVLEYITLNCSLDRCGVLQIIIPI